MCGYTLATLPSSWDWREHGAVTGVKSQAECGSCWAFSTAANLEAAWYLAGHDLVSLSPQQLVVCDTHFNEGCTGGDAFLAMDYVVKSGGLLTWETLPYKTVDEDATQPSPTDVCGMTAAELLQPWHIGAKAAHWQYVTWPFWRESYEDDKGDSTTHMMQEDRMALALIENGPFVATINAKPAALRRASTTPRSATPTT